MRIDAKGVAKLFGFPYQGFTHRLRNENAEERRIATEA